MTFKLREGVLTAETDYGIVLLDEAHNQYWTLNPSAAIALRTLLDGGTEADAAQTLTEEYTVDTDTAHQDVRDLVGGLNSAGLAEGNTGDGAKASTDRPPLRPTKRRVHGRWPHVRGRQQRNSR
ncbi:MULTISPECIES: lasso peptide biosynthesis PqqD family chaperone [Streptomyces]|uniref:Lasso peptide biosynthesis PqqD family chaperone n=1 Tax=Streptomyces doebereineriae TaxID=3075528 RepID=A0ABU2VPW0_9ACTN|nr:lasso peptide biosynthesis PqqD family chaperone [Streptomyces sp. DSM 41640]MDT0487164.1 lasso peptide biosynthesis PqqD family chaperone [Streptomyces sp. DSM 41640]